MRVSITPTGTLDIEGNDVCLRGGRPVINSSVPEGLRAETIREEAGLHLVQYFSPQLGKALFYLEVLEDAPAERLWLRYWLERFDIQTSLDSFGLYFERIENLRAYLRSGYMSWDGSE